MSSYQIEIESEVDVPAGLEAAAVRAAAEALRIEEVPSPASLSIVLTDDSSIRELNRNYRGVDSATDVLSFPAGDPMPGMEELPLYLGDIMISVPYARRQAEQQSHTPSEEVQLLAIHGVLHLLGYDHLLPDEKVAMWQSQEEILASLGLSHVVPTEDSHD